MVSRFFARFDRQVLRPPADLAHPGQWRAPSTEDSACWQALRKWCFAGTGADAAQRARDGGVTRLAIAALQGGSAETLAPLLEALCQELDGSVRLAACTSGIARLRLRLGVKVNDSLPWRARLPSDPWDCGYLDERPECLEGLHRFIPRRMTLMVTHGLTEASVMRCVEALARRQATFPQPVRLLIDGEHVSDVAGFQSILARAGDGAPVSIIR